MAFSFRRFIKGIILKKETVDASFQVEGAVFIDTADNKAKIYTNAATHKVVTDDQSETLTNKTLTAPIINGGTITGVSFVTPTFDSPIINTQITGTALETDLSVSASALKVPTAAASKAYSDAVVAPATAHIAASSGVHGVTGSVVGTTDIQTLSAKTLTAPVVNTSLTGTAVESDLSISALSTKVPSASAAKAYTDNAVAPATAHIAASTGVHGVTGAVVGTTDTQTLSAKTLTSPVINTQITGTALESDLTASALSTKVPTAAATKSYTDLMSLEASRIDNLDIEVGTGSNILTISALGNNRSAISSSNFVEIAFKDSSLSSITAATYDRATSISSLVVPAGATLGHGSALAGYLYIYAIRVSSNTIELAVSSALFDEKALQSTTAISTSADDSGLYSTTARSNVPIRLVGRFTSTQTTAGNWAATPNGSAMSGPSIYAIGDTYSASSLATSTQATPTATTWYIPDSTTKVTVSPGIYQATVSGIFRISNTTNSTQAAMTGQLGTSSTPGSGLIDSEQLLVNAPRDAAGNEYRPFDHFSYTSSPFTISASTSIYFNVRYTNTVGTPTISNMGFLAVTATASPVTLKMVLVRIG